MVPGLRDSDLHVADLQRHERLAAVARYRVASPGRPAARRPVLATARRRVSVLASAARDLLEPPPGRTGGRVACRHPRGARSVRDASLDAELKGHAPVGRRPRSTDRGGKPVPPTDSRGDFSNVDVAGDPDGFVRVLDDLTALTSIRAYKQRTFALLGASAGAHVLDLGCGTGDDARLLAGLVAPGGTVVGIDHSETMIAQARERAAGTGLAVEFRVADALICPSPTRRSTRAEPTGSSITSSSRSGDERAGARYPARRSRRRLRPRLRDGYRRRAGPRA